MKEGGEKEGREARGVRGDSCNSMGRSPLEEEGRRHKREEEISRARFQKRQEGRSWGNRYREATSPAENQVPAKA